MSKLDDLNNAVAALTANVSTLAANVVAGDKAIQAEIAALTAAMATDDTDAIEAAVAKIQTLSATVGAQAQTIATDTTALTNSLIPPASK